MGCCFGKGDEELPPAFDPVIGLSEKLKSGGVHVAGNVISGSGSILGDSPVLQDKAYFEATLQQPGSFAIGVATRDAPLDEVLSQEKAPTAWTFTNKLQGTPVDVGDVIGCALDQGDYPVQVYFYIKGKVVHQISGIRGEVLPAFSVDDGAVLEANFGGREYSQGMPSGFQGIIKSMSLL
ncbi:hypothetical protein AB1Y20_007612 [Prymnesium parvum]|uniref:SPRY domain-containing protein n=1 Tax=Prymnesium parvum TaxID=97485 RepID=A0AB34IXF7_PRYPA